MEATNKTGWSLTIGSFFCGESQAHLIGVHCNHSKSSISFLELCIGGRWGSLFHVETDLCECCGEFMVIFDIGWYGLWRKII